MSSYVVGLPIAGLTKVFVSLVALQLHCVLTKIISVTLLFYLGLRLALSECKQCLLNSINFSCIVQYEASVT